jgi:hypothetical protein
MKKLIFLLVVSFGLPFMVSAKEGSASSNIKLEKRKAAIFVANREIKIPPNQAKVLEGLIASHLASNGFQVLTRNVILDSVSKSLRQPKIVDEDIKLLKEIGDFVRTERGEPVPTRSLEEKLSKQTSAMRLAQSLGANMILFATIQSYGYEKRIFKGNEIAPVATVTHYHNLRVSYRLGFSADGVSVAGDQIKVTRAWRESPSIKRETDDLLNDMVEEAASKLSKQILAANRTIKEVPKINGVGVSFSVKPALPGGAVLQLPKYEDEDIKMEVETSVAADVVIDGISIGAVSTEKMRVASGLHQIALRADGYKPWKRFINVSEDQEILVTLEMTQDGFERWKETINFFQEMSKNKKLTRAEMKLLEAKAEALKKAGLVINLDRSGLEVFKEQ